MIQLAIKARPGASLRERIENLSMPVPESGCWLWTASVNNKGYAYITIDGRRRLGHRIAYELWKGDIPEGLELDHLCRVPSCVNPDHLQPVSHRDNVLAGKSPTAGYAQQTRCKNGHPYDLFNTRVRKYGGRDCRACHRMYYHRAKHGKGRIQSQI